MKKVYKNPAMALIDFKGTLLQSASHLNSSGGTPSGTLAPDYDVEDDEDWGDEEDPVTGRRKV